MDTAYLTAETPEGFLTALKAYEKEIKIICNIVISEETTNEKTKETEILNKLLLQGIIDKDFLLFLEFYFQDPAEIHTIHEEIKKITAAPIIDGGLQHAIRN